MDHVPDGQAGVPILASAATGEVPVADAFVERFALEPTAGGALQGTSFAVKDMFDVAGRHTGCGNPTWRATHAPAAASAAVVDALRAAGARLLGKVRTDELAYSLDGSNVHEGAPRNPAAPARLTGGSSSGAAAAVAAGEVDFAVATDTAGSVRVPAAWCGLIGIRPTHARISVQGLTPLAPSFDTVGWLARSGSLVRRIGAVLLDARAGSSCAPRLVRDPALSRRAHPAQTASLDPVLGGEPNIVALDIDFDEAAECLRVLQAHEVWRTHGDWVEAARPHFGPGVAERFRAARAITAEQVRWAQRVRGAIAARLDAVLPTGHILCLPSVPGPAAYRDAAAAVLQAQRARLLPLTALASLSGRPQVSLPLGTAEGAPLGVSLLGWRYGDEALLQIAATVVP